jgi:serine/threonine-protein kinase
MKLSPGTRVGDRYTIIEKIGSGGMAMVYRAKDEKLDRDVTFKVLREEHLSDNEFIKRFNIEARAAASLSHQNIVSVYDVGNDGDIYYIVMEYIDGCTLKELINRKAPFGNKEVISVALQVASALNHAHSNGIIHRDIKPQNILVAGAGNNVGCVKVTDFGIARAVSSTTTTGEAMGSVHYFSPEQAQGGFVDAKSDIYSLGIMMFEMLTGTLPFDGDSPVALAMKHIKDPLPDITKLNPKASASLINIITKATQKRPYMRYQTAVQLISDLKAALKDDSGSFVSIKEPVGGDGQTIKVSGEDLQKIRDGAEQEEKFDVPVIEADEDIYDDIDDGYNPKDDGYDKNKEKKLVLAAVITSVVIIAVLSVVAYFVVDDIKNPKVKVPNFVGLSATEAEALADEKGVNITKELEPSEDVAEGTVMEQDVQKNSKIPKDDRVTIKVSTGSEKVAVPNVAGISVEDAKKNLEEVGLTLGEVKYETSTDVISGLVIRPSLGVGNMVMPGTAVGVYVSTGKDMSKVPVPNVLGMTKDEAFKALQDAGFVVSSSEAFSDGTESGKVATQSPSEGNLLISGETVTIVISKGKNPAVTTETTTETTTLAPVVQVQESAKVSIPLTADFDKLNLEEQVDENGNPVSNPTIRVKVIAKTDTETRVALENTYTEQDFPFTLNDPIDKTTTYEVYYNDVLIKTETKRYS